MSKLKLLNKIRGFSLVEMVVVVSIFTLVIGSVAIFSIDSFRFADNDRKNVASALLMQDMSDAVIKYKSELWSEITASTGGGMKHLGESGGNFIIIDGTQDINGITFGFTVGSVYRDASGNIVESGGTLDTHSRAIVMTSTWTDIVDQQRELTNTVYVNNWDVQKWSQSLELEFAQGSNDDTYVDNDIDGEVQLDTVFYPDWCEPSLSINHYDIPGNGYSTTVFARPGYAYLGTGGNSSGDSFTKVQVSGVNPPSIVVEGVFDDYFVNNIFVEGDYAYLATDDNGKELVILDISSLPYTEVGYYNGSGSTDGYSVYVKDNVAYLAQGRSIRAVDVSSKIGARPTLGSITLSSWSFAVVSQVVINGDYLYASVYNDWFELALVNITDPTNLVLTSQTSVNELQTYDIVVSEDGNRTYLGTNHDSTGPEFFIIDTSSKNGARPIISSFETGGITVRGIALIEEDEKVILVGTSGSQQYQVLDISNESSPTKCGYMVLNLGITDIDSVEDTAGNVYSYLMTRENESEFKIILGGPGGGGGDGYGYMPSGTYTSQVFDTGSSATVYYSMDWEEIVPAGTDIKIQVRAGTSSPPTGSFVGPDGTSATYFTDANGENLPSVLNGKRYFQYKVYLTSTNIEQTPELTKINLYYEN